MINIKAYNPFYDFLMDSRFRVYRHILLILIMGVVASNSVFLVYSDHLKEIKLFHIIGGQVIIYMSIIYLNAYIVIPRFLLKKRYVLFITCFICIVLFVCVGDLVTEYYIHQYYQLPFGKYAFFHPDNIHFLEILSSLLVISLYLSSITITVFFKSWMSNKEKLTQLRKSELRFELEDFKNSISPAFLLNTLHIAATFTQTVPHKASQILLKLSHVLRYQLYDCKRDYVVLNSEIKFIHGYLELEQMRDHNLNFVINTPNLFRPYLVPPLLFIFFIEEALKQLNKQDGNKRIEINVSITDQTLTFMCRDNRKTKVIKADYQRLQQRLQLLNNEKHELELQQSGDLSQTYLIYTYSLRCH